MKYNHDSMLPIGAFKPRGSVVGGRSMRLHSGDSGYFDQAASDAADLRHAQWMAGRGDTSMLDRITAAAPAPAPVYNEPAPAPWSPPPEPAPVYNPPAPAAPAAPAAPDWTQTINDIYQQEFGRQADPSGLASFTNLLNQGLTGEQMREALRTSAEGQSRGLSPAPQGIASLPAATPTAYTPFDLKQYGYNTDLETQYYNVAKLANWQMSQGRPDVAQQYIQQANELKKQLDSPFRVDTITGGGGGDAGAGVPETVLVDRSGNIVSNITAQDDGKYAVVAPGTGDAGASTTGGSFTLDDIIKQSQTTTAFGAGRGQAIGQPYELKNADGEPYQRYDANGNLTEFVNRLTGEWTKASDVKPIGTVFDPTQGKMVTQYEYGDNKFIATPGGSTFAPIMDPYSKDTGGFMGEGGWARAGALVAAGLTAGLASGALVPGSIAAAGPGSASALGLSAAKGALTSMAVSGIQGATPAQMLKAGVLGGLGAGLGDFIGAAELGTAGNIAAKAGVQTGLTAIAGGNVQNALISSLINSTLPVVLNEALPPETSKILSDLPKPVQTVIMSTAGSVLNAGVTGKDISDAAVGGVTNGLISLGKDFAKGAFKDLSESELAQTVKNYLNPSYEEFQALPQDANATLDDVIRALPKTDTTASAKDPYSTDSILAALTEGYKNAPSTTGLPQYAGATTSDANPPSYGGDRYGAADTESPGGGDVSTLPEVSVNADEDSLRLYNQVMKELGRPTADSLDDPNFISALDRINKQTYNPDAPLDEPFKPQLPANAYDPAIKALEDAGLEVSYKTLDEFTQDPGALVDAVYPALAGRQPTEQERINFIDQYSNSATASPQDLLKDIYDQVQLDKQVPVYIDQSTSAPVPTPKPETPAPETKPKPPVPDEEVKKLIESSKAETTKLVSDLDSKIAANEEAGMERDAATDKPIEELAEATGKSDEEIKKLVADSQSVTEKLVSNIDAKIAANEKAGMNRDAATDKAIADLAKSTGASDAAIKKIVTDNQAATTKLVSSLDTKIAANEKAGMTRDQATDKAVKDLAASTGKSDAELKQLITTSQTATTKLVSDLAAKVAANEASGMTRDQATQKAVTDLAASTGKSDAELKQLIASSQASTSASISGLKTSLESKIAANEKAGMSRDAATDKAIKDLATATGKSDADLKNLISGTKTGLESSMSQLKDNLQALITANESAGLSRDEATQQAIKNLSATTGTSVADLNKLIQTTSTELTGAITGLKSNLETQIAANEKSGMARDAATDKAIADLSKSTGTSVAELKSLISSSTQAGKQYTQTQIASLQSNLSQKIAANEASGLSRDQAMSKAITDLAKQTSLSDTELKNLISSSTQASQQYTQTQIAGLQTTLSQQIAANEKSGMSRDAATDKAIADLAKQTNLSDIALKDLISSTAQSGQQYTQAQISGLQTTLSQQIAANEASGMARDVATDKAIKDLAASTNLSDIALKNLISSTAQSGQQYTQQQVANLQSTLSQQIAANEKSGLTRDQATDKAIADLAKSTGTSVSDLKNAIAGVNANVASSVSGLKSNLEALIAANETAGLSRDQATQNAINSLAASTGTSVSDLKNLISTTQAELAGAIGSSAQAGQQYTQTQVANLQSTLSKQIAANEAAGMTRANATDQAINDLARQTSMSDTELRNLIGTSAQAGQQYTQAQIAGLQNTLSQQMAVNEATGMSRDQALSTAISSVAASLGTSTATLMGLIGEATGSLGSQIAGIGGGLSDLSSSFEAYQKEQEEKQAAAAKLQQQKQAAAAKQKTRDQLISAMSQTQQVSVKAPTLAEIDYLYDIGGESIFAPPRSKTNQRTDQQYADGGLIENGSIEDLYALLRSI